MADAGVEMSVKGAEQFRDVAKQLRAAGDKDLTRELYAALNRGADPMKEAIRTNFASRLPQGGGRGARRTRKVKTGATLTNAVSGKTHAVKIVRKGGMKASESLAKRAAGATISVKGTAGRNPKVTITARTKAGKSIDLKALDAGNVRHPIFGNRRKWVSQTVTPNTFSDGVESNLDGVRDEILRALDAMTAKLATGKGDSS